MPQDSIKSSFVNSIKPEKMSKICNIKKTHEGMLPIELAMFC